MRDDRFDRATESLAAFAVAPHHTFAPKFDALSTPDPLHYCLFQESGRRHPYYDKLHFTLNIATRLVAFCVAPPIMCAQTTNGWCAGSGT